MFAVYPALEATPLLAANSATITARQQVTAEIALTAASSAITMSPAIAGLTGGTGNGETVITVITNNNTGYTVTVQATTTPGKLAAMNGETQGGYIHDYDSATPQTWEDNSSGGTSQYGFGITNGTLSSSNGASGFGTCSAADACFAKAPTTTAITVVNVSSETPITGNTFTLKFRVQVPANSNPLLPEDYYTATTTVTATVN